MQTNNQPAAVVMVAMVLIAASCTQGVAQVDSHQKTTQADDATSNDIQFDCTLMIDAPVASTRIALFQRNTVGKDDRSFELRWAEPHWQAFNFPRYPVSLNVHTDQTQLTVQHGFYPDMAQRIDLQHVGDRPAFNHVANGYAISDLAYARREELVGGSTAIQPLDAVSDRHFGHITKSWGKHAFVPEQKGVGARAVAYKYLDGNLSRMKVVMSPFTITGGGMCGQFIEAVGDEKTRHEVANHYALTHHAGGRLVDIEMHAVSIPGVGQRQLPRSITIRSDKGSRFIGAQSFLRSSRFNNYLLSSTSQTETSLLSTRYLTAVKLISKYWNRQVADSDDRILLENQRVYFRQQLEYSTDPVEKLMCIRVLMMHGITLGVEVKDLTELANAYFEGLEQADAGELLVEGGRTLINLLENSGRSDAAMSVGDAWLQVIGEQPIAKILDMLRVRKPPRGLAVVAKHVWEHRPDNLTQAELCELAIHRVRMSSGDYTSPMVRSVAGFEMLRRETQSTIALFYRDATVKIRDIQKGIKS